MPRKDETATPKKLVDKFIKRHYEGGESVDTLAKEYRISRATGYMWLMKHRRQLSEEAMRKDVPEATLDKQDKASLRAQIAELKLENAKLRNRVVAMMIKSGDL